MYTHAHIPTSTRMCAYTLAKKRTLMKCWVLVHQLNGIVLKLASLPKDCVGDPSPLWKKMLIVNTAWRETLQLAFGSERPPCLLRERALNHCQDFEENGKRICSIYEAKSLSEFPGLACPMGTAPLLPSPWFGQLQCNAIFTSSDLVRLGWSLISLWLGVTSLLQAALLSTESSSKLGSEELGAWKYFEIQTLKTTQLSDKNAVFVSLCIHFFFFWWSGAGFVFSLVTS